MVQHGIAPGYYITFFLGGVITSDARLARAGIRPLLLPAPGQRPSLLKRAYDVAGAVLAVTLMNFATVPFMLLTVRDSVAAWTTLRWYGLYIIFGSAALFYAGGSARLRGMQKAREKKGTLYVDLKKVDRSVKPGTGTLNGTGTPEGVSTPNAGPGLYPPALEQVVPPPK